MQDHFHDKLSKILVLYDVSYHGYIQSFSEKLKSKGFPNIIAAHAEKNLNFDKSGISGDNQVATSYETSTSDAAGNISVTDDINSCEMDDCGCVSKPPIAISSASTTNLQYAGGLSFHLKEGDDIQDYAIFFIGPAECAQLNNIAMRYSRNKVVVFDPVNLKTNILSLQVNKALMKRFVQVQKVRNASVIGVVAGTLGVDRYMSVLQNVKSLITSSGRKCYTFVVGKINVPKLSNFAEIEAFTLVIHTHTYYIYIYI